MAASSNSHFNSLQQLEGSLLPFMIQVGKFLWLSLLILWTQNSKILSLILPPQTHCSHVLISSSWSRGGCSILQSVAASCFARAVHLGDSPNLKKISSYILNFPWLSLNIPTNEYLRRIYQDIFLGYKRYLCWISQKLLLYSPYTSCYIHFLIQWNIPLFILFIQIYTA